MFRKKPYLHAFALLLLLAPCLFAGCYKEFVPGEKDYFSRDANFNKTDFIVWLGSTNVSLYIFNADYSTQPLEFSILNCRRADTVYITADSSKYQIDTVAAPELRTEVPVQTWDSYYSGKETSLAEIAAKKHTEHLPVLDIRPNSGDIFFYNTTADVVRPGKYFFDVKVHNEGGQQTYHMTLDVRRSHPYDPFDFDDVTGKRLPANNGGILHPTTMNGVVDVLNRNLPADSVDVSFHKVGNTANTLTIKFLDADSQPIKLSNFNRMQWDSLRYTSAMTGERVPFGFNRQMAPDSTAVTWDIPNPFPVLADVSGSLPHAAINFTYNRISFSKRVDAAIGMEFAIFEPGQWELIFKFHQNPKFGDD